jgi:hypothetical protein
MTLWVIGPFSPSRFLVLGSVFGKGCQQLRPRFLRVLCNFLSFDNREKLHKTRAGARTRCYGDLHTGADESAI